MEIGKRKGLWGKIKSRQQIEHLASKCLISLAAISAVAGQENADMVVAVPPCSC